MSRHRGAKHCRRYGLLGSIQPVIPGVTFYPLSDGPSTRNHRITMADFRLCSTCLSRSQAGLCHCTRRPISDRSEPTIARLRYSLGGDRPSPNCPPCNVPDPDKGPRLDIHVNKGGISHCGSTRAGAPASKPTTYLHMPTRMPLQSYSKGARGLSSDRGNPHLHGNSISLSQRWRQRGVITPFVQVELTRQGISLP